MRPRVYVLHIPSRSTDGTPSKPQQLPHNASQEKRADYQRGPEQVSVISHGSHFWEVPVTGMPR